MSGLALCEVASLIRRPGILKVLSLALFATCSVDFIKRKNKIDDINENLDKQLKV